MDLELMRELAKKLTPWLAAFMLLVIWGLVNWGNSDGIVRALPFLLALAVLVLGGLIGWREVQPAASKHTTVTGGSGPQAVTGSGISFILQIANQYAQAQPQEKVVDLEVSLRKYLEWVKENTEFITLRGIVHQGVQQITLKLDTVYVPLEAEVFNPGEHKQAVPLNRLLEQGHRLALIGGPGCGKSTVLQHMSWVLAGGVLTNDAGFIREKLGQAAQPLIPVLIPLNRYAAHLRKLKDGQSPQLEAFLSDYFKTRQIPGQFSPEFWDYLFSHNRVVLLLDGLDEVPTEDLRAQVRQRIEDFLKGHLGLWVIATSRSAAYHGEAVLANFKLVRVLPLEQEHIENLVRRAYQAIPKTLWTKPEPAGALLKGIRALEAQREGDPLVTTPLMVRLLLLVQQNNRDLPDQRADLYEKAVEALLKPDHKDDGDVARDLVHFGAGSLEMNRDMLQYLAYHMHQSGEQQGRDVGEEAIKKMLCQDETYRPHVEALLEEARTRSTLLEFREQQYRFMHLSFQEFLAGRYLAKNNTPDEAAAFLEAGPATQTWWREAILLYVGYAYLDQARKLLPILRRMAAIDEKAASRPEIELEKQLAMAELAATAYGEIPNRPAEIGDELRQRLEQLAQHPQRLQPPALRRANAADAAVRLSHIPDGLYDLVEIDPRRLDPKDTRPPFWISRYPVTNAHYGRFLEQVDFRDESLWKGVQKFDRDSRPMEGQFWDEEALEWLRSNIEGAAWSQDGSRRIIFPRFWDDPRFGIARPYAPVVGVTYYEAAAYCQWLQRTWAQREEYAACPSVPAPQVRLPTEAEWVLAAGGDKPERRCPWGKGPAVSADVDIPARANVSGSGIGRTTPVDLFPDGRSHPYGVWDLAGNAWEWLGSLDEGTSGRLRLRGGAWDLLDENARLSVRDAIHPNNQWDDGGFRVAVLRPY